MKNKIANILLLILSLLLLKCAHQVAPTGGEEDKIPPLIVEFYPANGTTNFSGNSFEITFSEYVQKSSVREAIFISPKINGELSYSWTGKTLKIEFDDTLKANTTYTITVGTDVQDYNNRNKMAEAYSFVFSTGSRIDKGEISGQVYDDKPDGALIYVFHENDTLVNPLHQEPDYISQVGTNGKFTVQGFAPGKYFIYAIRDDLRNYLYNVGVDSYGVPSSEIILTGKDSSIQNLKFMLTQEDTTAPNILSVVMTDEAHLQIEFSEYVDSSKINSNIFYIYDSTNNQRHNLLYFYKGTGKPKHIFSSFNDSLITENNYYLVVDSLYDKNGNVFTMSVTTFAVNEIPDTIPPQIKNVNTEFGNNVVDYASAYVQLVFNDGINTANANQFIGFYFEKQIIPVKIYADDNSSITIKPEIVLRDNKDYELKIDLSKIIDSKGNVAGDSVYTIKLKTKNKLDFSGLSGKVRIDSLTNILVNLKSVGASNKFYTVKADSTGVFNFPRVTPGKYVLWSFVDNDENGKYSFGNVYPYKPSEDFVFYPDTLELKPRWPVGDVELDY